MICRADFLSRSSALTLLAIGPPLGGLRYMGF